MSAMGRARKTRGLADPTRVMAWTREQIEAWVECRDARSLRVGYVSNKLRAAVQTCRREIVRLCPEVADYDALVERLEREVPMTFRAREWLESAAPNKLRAHTERVIAALWHQSLSEPSDGEALE